MTDIVRFVANWANDHSAMLAGLAVLATLVWFLRRQFRPYLGAGPAVVAALLITGGLVYVGSLILDQPPHVLVNPPKPVPPVNEPATPVTPPPTEPEVRPGLLPQPVMPPTPSCPQDGTAREAPIRALFMAWQTLDIDLYAAQWTQDAIQYYGHGRFRDFDGIVADRRRIFAKLDHVDVGSMNLSYAGAEGAAEKYQNDYALYYYFKDGRVLPDLNLQETYLVVCDASSGRWKIKLNDDQKR